MALTVEERLAPAAFVALSVLMLMACWWKCDVKEQN
jgi:hypothetical protein